MGNRQRYLAEAFGTFVPGGGGRVPVGRLVCACRKPGGTAGPSPGCRSAGGTSGREPA